MTTISGSSRYYNSATLANKQGSVVSAPNILGSGGSTTSLLDAGRQDTGIGLSSTSRSLTNQLLSQSASSFNKVFSLNGVEFGTNETLVQKIKAIRASLPESRISDTVLGDEVDTEA